MLTLIHCRPPSATTSTLTPASLGSPRLRGWRALPVSEYVLQIAVTGGGAQRTSFHTEMRYGAFVDRAGRRAHSGSARNYCKGVHMSTRGQRAHGDTRYLFEHVQVPLHRVLEGPHATHGFAPLHVVRRVSAGIAGRVDDRGLWLPWSERGHGVEHVLQMRAQTLQFWVAFLRTHGDAVDGGGREGSPQSSSTAESSLDTVGK